MSIDELKAKVADLSPWTKEMENNARNLAVAQGFLSNAIGGVVDMLGNAFAPILTPFHTGCLRLGIRCHQHCSWCCEPQDNPKPKK